MASFVLVHGAWHGGWCWQRVAARLRAAGHEVCCPTLTGLGERTHLLLPSIDLDTHIQDVVNVLAYEDLTGVVLVGHSYAGAVVTGVADRTVEQLIHLVYLDAFIPHDGEALFDLHPPPMREAMRARSDTEGEGWQLLPPPFSGAALFGITDPADIAWVQRKLTPQPRAPHEQPLRLRCPAGSGLPRTFIYCANKAPGDPFAAMAQRVHEEAGWRYHELATGHDAMITAPAALTELLLEVVEPPPPM
ncbi:MAG TPA: alpha/beta fold hydrolase [Chloroflexota bacterium]|nr:alpha/beta fold hydrolase [Chloroflexota bacterium]